MEMEVIQTVSYEPKPPRKHRLRGVLVRAGILAAAFAALHVLTGTGAGTALEQALDAAASSEALGRILLGGAVQQTSALSLSDAELASIY